jgi:cytochrome c biogenesis protein CcmG, thiol:disulfide interchange protein DsbE
VKRRWRWLLPLAALPLLALLAYGFVLDPKSIPSPLVGRQAAAFTLTAFDGKALTLESFRGKVVVVNFWASWCNPACYEEAPVLERAWRTYEGRGVVVIGVDMQDTTEAAQEFIRRFELTFPNAPDHGGKMAVEYGVYGVPETFFVDRMGTIRAKHVGALTDEIIRGTLDRLL